MYAPAAFRWEDRGAALAFAARRVFATLLTVTDAGELLITHLPLLVDADKGCLRGHVARANSHAGALDGRRHVAVFAGPDGYISPDWYPDGDDVPTWNYAAIHVSGTGRIVADPDAVHRFLVDLSDQEEARRYDLERGAFWKIEKLDARDIERMKRAITVFEIDIEAVEAKAKLSQNKPRAARESVIAALAASPRDGERDLAAMMAQFGARRR